MILDLQKTHLAPVAAVDRVKALVYCARGDDVDTVIVDGVVRVAGGTLLGVDLAPLWEGAERFNAKLTASVAQMQHRNQPLSAFYEPAFPDWQEKEGPV